MQYNISTYGPKYPEISRIFFNLISVSIIVALLLGISSCAPTHRPISPYTYPQYSSKATQRPYMVDGHIYYPLPRAQGFIQTGYASWYGGRFHGRKTADGERYNMYAYTAAHKTLPMNTIVRVTNLENHRHTIVRINDRGPFVKNRIIDLSYAAARSLGIVKTGTALVRLTVLGRAKRIDGKIIYARHPDFQTGDFFVQLGAFNSLNRAVRFKHYIETRYRQYTRITRVIMDGETLYRVQIFAAHNYQKAQEFKHELENQGFQGAFVVAR